MKRRIFTIMAMLIFLATFSVMFNSTSADQSGSIYGMTYTTLGFGIYPLPFVHVSASDKHDISNIFGYYEIQGLPVNQVYEVTASKKGYKTVNLTVELTSEDPDQEVNIMLTYKGDSEMVISNEQLYQGDPPAMLYFLLNPS